MNYNTVYVGMDVHKESFSLCAYTIETEKASHYQRTDADYKKVLNYLKFLRTIYGDDANFDGDSPSGNVKSTVPWYICL